MKTPLHSFNPISNRYEPVPQDEELVVQVSTWRGEINLMVYRQFGDTLETVSGLMSQCSKLDNLEGVRGEILACGYKYRTEVLGA